MAWLDNTNVAMQTGLDGQMREAATHLSRRDPVVRSLVKRFGVYRMESTRSHFQVMMETVVSQQLSTSAARSIYNRLRDVLGRRSPRPRDVLQADDRALRGAGLSRSKVRYVNNVAEAFTRRDMRPGVLAQLRDDDVMKRLTSIAGIGEWSAHMFLMFALNRLDVFPIGDLGLRNAMVTQYDLRRLGKRREPSAKRLHEISERWRPYRTVGSLYLWKSYDGI